MAIPNNYIDKITKDGESRDICPDAGKVRVDNENFEGADLNEVLNEVAGAIDEAASGGYAPPEGGIPATDLAQSVQDTLNDVANKVDKVPGKGLSTNDYTDADKALVGTIGDKANAADVYNKAEVDAAVANAGSGAVSVTTNQDGTFTIHVGETDYTINLNHSHPNMAKFIACEQGDLPSQLERDTIYAQVDSLTTPHEIEKLFIFGLEFTGTSSRPSLQSPINGSTINVDDLTSGVLIISGTNLTQQLTVAVTGDFTVNGNASATVSAASANAGTTVVIACTSQSDNVAGTLSITSNDGISVSCDLRANVVLPTPITGVKFTGTQWLEMGFDVSPTTRFAIDMEVVNDASGRGNNRGYYSTKTNAQAFSSNFASVQEPRTMMFVVGGSSVSAGYNETSLHQRGTLAYENGKVQFLGVTKNPSSKTVTSESFRFGYSWAAGSIFNFWPIILYGFKVWDIVDGVEQLTHDYVPVIMYGKAGLFDNVSETFISNAAGNNTELVAIQSNE